MIPLNGNHVLVRESNQRSLIELALVPYGLESRLGLQAEALGYVLPTAATNRWIPLHGPTLKLGGPKAAPWRVGLVHYRIPRDRSQVRVQMMSGKGAAVRLTSQDPYLRIGYSQTCITIVRTDSICLNVNGNFSSSMPTLKLLEESNSND